jgi:Helicase conserved C-terminal domain
MTSPSLENSILSRPRFVRTVNTVTASSILGDLPAIKPSAEPQEPDWNFALFCCSAMTQDPSERAQEAILRIVQACLSSADSTTVHKEASALLLKRLGNMPSVTLARSRGLLAGDGSVTVPLALALDADSRSAELNITTSHGSINGNPFQERFWQAAGTSRWLSFSAPTSAGKSHIVREWLREMFARNDSYVAAYVAPTRALVEEVSRQLRADLGAGVTVVTLPWDPAIGTSPREMYVFTQERMHLLQQRSLTFAPELLFVDEAQKLGEGARGVLLSQVLDEAVNRNTCMQVIFASPMASNPDLLLDGAPEGASTGSFTATTITVNQNLLAVGQVPRKPLRYTASLLSGGNETPVGEFTLPSRPTRPAQRLPFVAVALAGGAGGNVVYANGPADAEKMAIQIHELLGTDADLDLAEVTDAIDYVRGSIHDRYALAMVLRRGVAFHYGNMPLQVKAKIEALFRMGIVKYLVCTSTLLEGVNLPCRNIFIRGPRKGKGNPMSPADFWNLAGRAGRWGKEFQGNIVCVDVSNDDLWPQPPAARVRVPLTRAADLDAGAAAALGRYIEGGAAKNSPQDSETIEPMFSFMASRVLEGRDLVRLYGLGAAPVAAAAVEQATRRAVEGLEIPASLAARHAGISPVSIQQLMTAARRYPEPGDLPLVLPESDDAIAAYKTALDLIDESLGGPFGPDGRRWSLARLIVNWMRGVPLSQLIDGRIEFLGNRGDKFGIAAVIRQVMGEVEEIARFQAPKYLACYADVIAALATGLRLDLDPAMPDITMMLELGVPRETDMSLINLGLSRATTLAVSALITSDHLDVAACQRWLNEHDIEALGLPAFAAREILDILQPPSP